MRLLAYLYLRLRRWQFVGELPAEPKFVAIGAPHTSNWDFVVFLGLLHHFGIRARYLGKHTLFRWPFGGLMRRLGGIPVDRDRPGAVAAEVAREFASADSMALVIAPEGTRARTRFWKSGFYRIALTASVPIVPAAIDLARRRATIGAPIHPTGRPKDDMDRIRAFYAGAIPALPADTSPIVIQEELDDSG